MRTSGDAVEGPGRGLTVTACVEPLAAFRAALTFFIALFLFFFFFFNQDLVPLDFLSAVVGPGKRPDWLESILTLLARTVSSQTADASSLAADRHRPLF